jgi:glycosyltransferase involved in cell wall biosynthesis
MRIAFDATALPARPGGAGKYILRLVEGLCRLPIDGRLYVFAKAGDLDRFGSWPPHAEPVPVRVATRPTRIAWEQTGLPVALRRLDIDLLHSPHYTLPLAAGRTARVVTFHDMTCFLAAEHHQPVKRAYFRSMIRAAARRADLVITVSESTRADACRVLGLDPRRTVVIHEAADAAFKPVDDPAARAAVERRHGLRHPFVLTVATLEPRKNIGAAVRLVARLRAQGLACSLAVAGARGWGDAPVFDEVRRHGLGDHVRFLGYVPDADLPALYSACDLFLYPSLYEGFGLPPLEAMACGATVIVTDRSSLPEVVADGGLQYDPDDEDALARLATNLMTDELARQPWRDRGLRRAARFTWEQTARRTYDAYQTVLASPRG